MKSDEIQAQISLKRHEIMVLQARLVDVIGRETGVKKGTIVKKNGREWEVTHLEGESAQHMAVYGVVKTKYSVGRRNVWLGSPSSLEVVK